MKSFKPALMSAVLILWLTTPESATAEDSHSDAVTIEFESEVFAKRGQGVVTQNDFDVFLARIPQHHRAAYLADPRRIAEVLDSLLPPRQLAAEARDRASEVLDDPLFQGQLYQAAIVQIAERYMTDLWEQERLEDYTDQARELYLVRKDLLRLPQKADFTHVLIRSQGVRGELEAMKTIIGIYEQLAEGRTLADLAAEYSEDPEMKQNSGRYEGAAVTALDPAVATAIRELEAGQISQPFKSEFGWHVLELHKRYRPEIENFDQVRERAIEVAESRHKASVRERILRRLNLQETEFASDAVQSLLERYEVTEQDLEKLKSDIRARLGRQQQ